MNAAHQNEWLWCDDNSVINKWFIHMERLKYPAFYASFINFANQAIANTKKPTIVEMTELPRLVVALLLKDPIPAEELLDLLQRYSRDMLDDRGFYQRSGLVPFHKAIGT
jgi:hypothetical protein